MADRPDVIEIAKLADGSTSAVNRGLLKCERDVLIVPAGMVPESTCIDELLRVLHCHDRVAATTPMVRADDLPEGVEAWPTSQNLPESAEVPAPSHCCVMLRADALKMAGALDPMFTDLHEALTDWCMRAQRLGFLTLMSLRAWVHRKSTDLPTLVCSQAIADRHFCYEVQRKQAEAALAARLPHQSLALERGPISVCIDARTLPEDAVNGTGVYAVELGRALTKHTPCRVTWLCLTDGQQRALERSGMPVFREGQPMPPFDLVHRPSQVFRPTDLPWLLSAQAPLVVSFLDLIAYRASSAAFSPQAYVNYRLAAHFLLRSAQSIIAISEHNRGEIIAEFDLPAETVHACHLGVHPDRFATRDRELNRRVLHGLGVPERFFFCIGSDYAHKNLRLVLAAYASFKAKWPGSGPAPSLVLVGHPSGTADGIYPRLREGGPPGVSYLGDISDEAIRAVYQEGLALLFLSGYEGFGLPVLEAMSASTPVLCSRWSSIPEVAGDAGYYADDLSDRAVALQMLELAQDDELRRRLGEAGRLRAAAFTWEANARKTFAAYQQALRAPRHRSLHERQLYSDAAARIFPSQAI